MAKQVITPEHRAKLCANVAKARLTNPTYKNKYTGVGRPKSFWANEPKRPPGRPKKVRPDPTEEEKDADLDLRLGIELRDVRELSQLQVGDEEISVYIQQPIEYVNDVYRREIDRGKLMGKVRMLKVQFQKAYEGSTNMMMWLGKHYFGQRDGVNNTTFEPEFRILTKAIERLEDGSSLIIEHQEPCRERSDKSV